MYATLGDVFDEYGMLSISGDALRLQIDGYSLCPPSFHIIIVPCSPVVC